jgi:hypothetical protein
MKHKLQYMYAGMQANECMCMHQLSESSSCAIFPLQSAGIHAQNRMFSMHQSLLSQSHIGDVLKAATHLLDASTHMGA